MKPRSGLADVHGTKLHYEVEGQGPPLVLVHGFGLDSRMWDEQIPVFAQRYTVLSYDARGYGRSASPPLETYSHSDDLAGLLDALGIEGPVKLIGLSMGGSIVTQFSLDHRERTDAIVLANSFVTGFKWITDFGDRLAALTQAAKEEGVHAARTLWLQDTLFDPARERAGLGDRLAEIVAEYSGWHWTSGVQTRPPDTPAIQRLHEVTARTLVIVGERDAEDFLRIADILAAGIAGARKIVLPGVGHMSNMEDAVAFNRAVLEFLGRD